MISSPFPSTSTPKPRAHRFQEHYETKSEHFRNAPGNCSQPLWGTSEPSGSLHLHQRCTHTYYAALFWISHEQVLLRSISSICPAHIVPHCKLKHMLSTPQLSSSAPPISFSGRADKLAAWLHF